MGISIGCVSCWDASLESLQNALNVTRLPARLERGGTGGVWRMMVSLQEESRTVTSSSRICRGAWARRVARQQKQPRRGETFNITADPNGSRDRLFKGDRFRGFRDFIFPRRW